MFRALVVSLAVAVPAFASVPARYVVCEIDRNDFITVRSVEDVTLAGEMPSEEPQLFSMATFSDRAAANRVDATITDVVGHARFHTSVAIDRHLRAEFTRNGRDIEGRLIEPDVVSFVVRVPADRGPILELTAPRTHRTTRVNLGDVPKRRFATDGVGGPSVMSASPANRLDILIMGDGYTSAQSAQFQTDANNVASQFLGISPYNAYSNYINVTNFFTASPQSGADHPFCSGDPVHNPDPLEGTYVNTAFDATFCSFGTQRLLTVDASKVFAAAAAVANWDKIIVIVNDTMYGGAGGSISTVSTNGSAIDVIRHEFGHSFTGLADEYSLAYGYPACSDISGSSPCEPNVTNVSTRASVKWNSWIAAGTPVPTTPQANYPNVPGLFEGARYHTTGFYRPRYDCLMNHLGVGFCEVCAQSFVLRLYDGWGGAPAAGIDMIEPSTESPAPGATTAALGDPKSFSATILEPLGGPAATKEWLVDGVVQAGQSGASFNWTPSSGGSHTVMLRVTDGTALVKAAMAGTSLQTTRTWTVSVSSIPAPATFTAAAGTSGVALSWSAVQGATSYEIARGTINSFTTIATVSGTAYDDAAVSTNTAYVYKVRAVGGAYSKPDLATVFSPTDSPLTAGTKVKAIHLTQLRTAINAARAAAGLGAASYTYTPAAGGLIRAVDIAEMRTAANAARTALGMLAYEFITSTLTPGSVIRAAHINDLRTAIR